MTTIGPTEYLDAGETAGKRNTRSKTSRADLLRAVRAARKDAYGHVTHVRWHPDTGWRVSFQDTPDPSWTIWEEAGKEAALTNRALVDSISYGWEVEWDEGREGANDFDRDHHDDEEFKRYWSLTRK